MKLKLSEAQEKVFWSTVAEDLIITLELGSDPQKWNKEDLLLLQVSVAQKIIPLCKKQLKVALRCNLEDKDLQRGTLDLRSTMYRIFVNQLYKKTKDYTKHRFSYFLIGQSASEYIKQKGLFLGEAEDAQPPETLDEAENPAIGKHLEETLKSFVQSLEFHAFVVQNRLKNISDQEAVQAFQTEFTLLHQKVVDYLLHKGDIQTGMQAYMGIYKLASQTFFQKEDGGEDTILNLFGGHGAFYLRGNSIAMGLRKYLFMNGIFETEIEQFMNLKDKTAMDYESLYRELLAHYRAHHDLE